MSENDWDGWRKLTERIGDAGKRLHTAIRYGVSQAILDAVVAAGPNSCPPMVVGVGIGGNMEMACLLAKRAAARDVGTQNPDQRYAAFEKDLLDMINKTGIGPQGLGGVTTAVAVNVEWAPTHIASLPVAVNINCHAARHAEATI